MKRLCFLLPLLLFGCAQQKYVLGEYRVYRVPKDSLIIRSDGASIVAPWDGYLISDATLVQLAKKIEDHDSQ